MNVYLIIAGALAVFCNIGHFTMGSKQYLAPMLQADFDLTAKKVMHCVFHYVSVFLVLSAAVLLAAGFGVSCPGVSIQVVRFIALAFTLCTVAQIVIALTSGMEKALVKMFQWTLFALIALFAWLGTCCGGAAGCC